MKCTIGRTLLREGDYRPSRYTQCSNLDIRLESENVDIFVCLCVMSFEIVFNSNNSIEETIETVFSYNLLDVLFFIALK